MHEDESTAPLSRKALEQAMQHHRERPQAAAQAPMPAPMPAPAQPPAPSRAPAPAQAPAQAPARAPVRAVAPWTPVTVVPEPLPLAPPGARVSPLPATLREPLTRAQVELGNRLLRLLPASHMQAQPVTQAICQVLKEVTGLDHELHFHGVRVLPGPATLPELGHVFLTRYSLPPDPDFGLLSCDLSLVESWLRGMLGEQDAPALRLGPPSEQDFGAVTYLLLRVAEVVARDFGMAPLALASSPPDLAQVRKHLSLGLDVVEVSCVISSSVTVGALRLWLPSRLVFALEVFSRGELTQRRLERRLWRSGWGELSSPMFISAGRVELGQLERFTLGVGDVLLPEHGLEVEGLLDEPAQGRLYFDGAMRGAYAPLRLVPDLERQTWTARVLDVSPARTVEMTMSQETEAQEGRTQALVDEARVTVELRVGSVQMSFKQLAQLQPGHVLALEQPLHQPVELVAQGRVIGSAELVNIEGRLGARILSLSDAS